MNHQHFAIYINGNDNIETINKLKNFIITQSPYSDIFITSDDNVGLNGSFSILSSFYLKFFHGSIIFTSLEDYISNMEVVSLAKNYVLIQSIEELSQNQISRTTLTSKATLLTITDGEIHEV